MQCTVSIITHAKYRSPMNLVSVLSELDIAIFVIPNMPFIRIIAYYTKLL